MPTPELKPIEGVILRFFLTMLDALNSWERVVIFLMLVMVLIVCGLLWVVRDQIGPAFAVLLQQRQACP
jgi:hypothetical protein